MIKVVHILFLICILPFLSCYQHIPEDKRECYKTVKKFTDRNWKFEISSDEEILVDDSTLFYTVIRDKDLYNCVITLNKTIINELFGEPHEISGKGSESEYWYFYTMAGCQNFKGLGACRFYFFRFNQKGRCISFAPGSINRAQ